uniref:DNA helicase n=1 Tax=Meloidogyne hapla TaxID=6305 RepID=A0A1I8BN18_MELHA
MKYRKRLFAMDELELKAAIELLLPDQVFVGAEKETMQEELVQWLLSEGLTARHEFLFYKEEGPPTPGAEGEIKNNQENFPRIWLLGRRAKGCPCCGGKIK